jgi:hypothetical protein
MMSDQENPLKVLVCGYEQGGTTLVSQLLQQHPNLYSGFECGFLLVDNPIDFLQLEPYYTIAMRGWGLADQDLQYVCQADSWSTLYARLKQCSSITKDKLDCWILDKTPKYMECLSAVLAKIPDVRCIVIVRDPRAVLWSWAKRSELSPAEWEATQLQAHCQRYLSYARGYRNAIADGFADRILLVHYEALCINQAEEARKMFDFAGLEFELSYLEFGKQIERFPNVYGNDISARYLAEYKEGFSKEACSVILKETEVAQRWFFRQNKTNVELTYSHKHKS